VDLILAGMTYPNAVSHVKLITANEEADNDDDDENEDDEKGEQRLMRDAEDIVPLC
jgi:hypothetical protein